MGQGQRKGLTNQGCNIEFEISQIINQMIKKNSEDVRVK